MKKGLTSRQVVENREKFGTNKLPEKKMKLDYSSSWKHLRIT